MNFTKLRRDMYFKFFSGKNSKWSYFLRSYGRLAVPGALWRSLCSDFEAEIARRADADYIRERADYYCRLSGIVALPADTPHISELKIEKPKVYSLDLMRYVRCFDPQLKVRLVGGDVTFVPEAPSIVKSRPIAGNNANSVVLKLNAIRHFIYVDDKLALADKSDRAIFRSRSRGNAIRTLMMEKYFGHPMVDAGDVGRPGTVPEQWRTHKLTLGQQLQHKFIVALEGNDVASNLKWVMSSNSIAVMPEPRYETWFMEGRLKPDYHYIRVAPDLSDLPERLQHYLDHPDEAEAIGRNARQWVAQFRDERRETLISLLVLKKYFEHTGQLS